MSPERRAELPPDLPSFWSHLYGPQNGILALFSGRRVLGRLQETQQAYFAFPHALDEAQAWIASQPGRELYQAAHLFSQPVRRKAYALPLYSLYVDLDGGKLDRGMLPPTLVVRSSPGHFQCYWRLAAPIPPAEGEQLNHRLSLALTSADKSGWDLSQLLRIPGTRNYKYPDQPVVTIVRQYKTSYTRAQLERWLPPLPAVPELAPIAAPVRGKLSANGRRILAGEIVKRRPDGLVDRSASLTLMAVVLIRSGMSPAEVVATLAERDVSLGWEKFSGRRDARLRYQLLVETVLRHQGSPRPPSGQS